ncbi:iron-siderophore ABC transporter substrate-binding protein [Mastigocladopsis repens]|uniref:iron-siderophore ABC transporter substrate-binding protein n=1 Tax=Mastigocladopsis repens TaxID=221287 RepID=UPI0004747C6A|nr:iron-siderophore ABC transporter substrate-binding protein [Mastigocladopsis repens]
MSKRLSRSIQLFFLMTFAFFLVTACYSNAPINTGSPKAQLAASECRVIQHKLGKICVPLNPQRIIVTDETTLEAVVELGLKPLAVPKPNILGSKVSLFGEKFEGITYIGTESQLNIEKIVQLHPDLILGLVGANLSHYKLLSHIAPTVILNFTNTTWKDTFLQIGEILGKTEKAKEVLAQYHQRVEKLRKVLGQKLSKTEVSVSRFYMGRQATQFRTINSFPVSVLQEVGFSIPVVQRQLTVGKQTYVHLNLERLDLLDADVLFVVINPGAEEIFEKYQKSPVWQLLNVVKNKRVYTVDSSYWIFGNIWSANAILNDLFKYLVGAEVHGD